MNPDGLKRTMRDKSRAAMEASALKPCQVGDQFDANARHYCRKQRTVSEVIASVVIMFETCRYRLSSMNAVSCDRLTAPTFVATG